jgi:3-deoxy-manno-octulosonate cytidylyltransferase (CMP-KDO synthetase)
VRAIGAIPARWASTRLPGKSLIPICGKPLIQWVVERTREARSLDEVIVATDDQRIADAVEGLGVRAVMTRDDHPSGTDRIAEAVEGLEADVVVNVQGDEPLIDPGLIDRLVASLADSERWDMATAATPIADTLDIENPSNVKVVCDAEGEALYFSRSVIPFIRDKAVGADLPPYWRHMGVYAYRKSFLEKLVATPQCRVEQLEKLEQLRALHIGGRILVLEAEDQGIGVDTQEDVKYVEALLSGKQSGSNHG